jgi:uncharacterized membrane protein YqgA involved in biofilm formation
MPCVSTVKRNSIPPITMRKIVNITMVSFVSLYGYAVVRKCADELQANLKSIGIAVLGMIGMKDAMAPLIPAFSMSMLTVSHGDAVMGQGVRKAARPAHTRLMIHTNQRSRREEFGNKCIDYLTI